MNFELVVDEAVALLRRRRRLTRVALRRQFELDEGAVADLVQELILGRQVARDEDGDVIVWIEAQPPASELRNEPERRQITVLFCDLVGSTAMANALDPEELRIVLRAFQTAATDVIASHGGFINRYMGDGILVFFGYPKAHEDDSARAVRAALELNSAIEALRPLADIRLQLRIGIATGIVVVGDVLGEGRSREEAVVGSTPNLAARLQSMAEPGEILIGSVTRRLIGHRFSCTDQGRHAMKGFDEPVPVWRVLAERQLDEVSDAGPSGIELGPLVDRVVELPVLKERWRRARDGAGSIITLRGDPGLGKSRLSEALREAAADQPHTVLRYYCSTRFQNTAFYPVMRQLHHAAKLLDDDSDDTKLAKLQALLHDDSAQDELAIALPYLAALLAIPSAEGHAPVADSPERQREQTLRVLEAQVLRLAQQQPVLVIVEDLHWVDPSTLGLLEQIARKIDHLPVMVLATGRPDFEPPWADLPQAQLLELSPLAADDRSAMVRHHAGGKPIPDEILEHILQKSDGIPLYVEELTKATMESGLLLEEADRFVLTGPMRTLAVPSTLHDSLLARLDRLAVVKEVVQVGAAIGREFPHAMLAALVRLPAAELQETLDRLSEAGLIHCRGIAPDASYVFKHALIQDAAYATMLRPKRQALHARIAQILEADAGAAAREPEVLAQHLIEAGLEARAVPFLQQAGLLASAAAAHTEACKYFEQGLALLPRVPDEASRHRLELGLRVHLGMSLAATRGFAAPEVEATNQRARELCRLIGETDDLFWVLRGLCALYIVRSDAATSRELSEHLVRLGEQTQRAEFLIEGYLMQGYTLVYSGEAQAGRMALLKALDIYRTADGARKVFPTPQDPAVAAMSLLAIVCWMLGEASPADAHAQGAVAQAEASGRPFDVAYAHCFVAMFENLRRQSERAAHHAGLVIEIATRHGFGVWQAAGAMHLGVAKAALGAAPEAVGILGATLPAWRASGAELNSGFFMAGLAAGHVAVGDRDQALATVSEAIAHAERHHEHYYDAELFRLRAEILAEGGASADAAVRADFGRAIETAQRQGTVLLELRAALGLVKRMAAAGDRTGARDLLASTLVKVTGAGASAEVIEAAVLLQELRA